MARNAVNQASAATNTAGSTASTLGGEAQGIGANVPPPFLTQEMLHPPRAGSGRHPGAEESAALEWRAGGANSGLVGGAMQRAAVSRNAGGYQAALADASRQRDKAAAGASEGIEAQNENLKQQQQQEGATGLQNQYKTDTSGMLEAMGQQAPDINAEANAGKSGWLQNAMGILGTIEQGASAAGSLGWKPLGK